MIAWWEAMTLVEQIFAVVGIEMCIRDSIQAVRKMQVLYRYAAPYRHVCRGEVPDRLNPKADEQVCRLLRIFFRRTDNRNINILVL